MLEAYLDESERKGGIFCVAGYLFDPRNVLPFQNEWRRLFSGRVCRMSELMHAQGAFSGLSQKECDKLLKAAVPIMNKYIKAGVAVSCYLAEIEHYSPRWIRGLGHAYPICCHLAMAGVGKWMTENHCPGGVIYTFEAGQEHESEAQDFINNVTQVRVARLSYRYRGHAFLEKADAIPLQAADLLAWEWAKCKDETVDRRIRPIRKSLRALIDSDTKRYKVLHFTGPRLREFLAKISYLGWTQYLEELYEKK